ncbi:hypothetical protein ACFL3S_03225 [Gemmatimonadota bacterium]
MVGKTDSHRLVRLEGRLVLGLLSAFSVGCSPESRPETPVAPIQVVHGFAVFGHEVRAFQPCGFQEALWAVDSAGLLWEVYQELAAHRPPYDSLYAVVEGHFAPAPEGGFGVDYPGTLVVTGVFHVAAEGDRCNRGPSEFGFWAGGNEPFWSASVSTRGLELQRLGQEALFWVKTRVESEGASLLISTDSPEGNQEGPLLVLRKDPCRDSMSGAYFGYSAQLFLRGDTLSGCAFRGGGPTVGDPPGGDSSESG